MIELIHVDKTYANKFKAVKDVSLRIETGQVVGIVGPSGAGKSTLIRMFNLLERPTSGTVAFDGVDIALLNEKKLRALRRHIGMIFQDFNLINAKTARQNVALPLILAGAPKKDALKRADALLDLVELSDKKNSYPSFLSGGQRQRVAIARALTSAPKTLLCDEATSALDPSTTDSILDLLKKINRDLGITIIIVAHDMHVIEKICDYCVIMENGSVVEENAVFPLFTNPQTDTARLLVKNVVDHDAWETLKDYLLIPEYRAGLDLIAKLTFLEERVSLPVLCALSRDLAMETSILYAQISRVGGSHFGRLIVRLSGDRELFERAVAYADERGVTMEALGYVE